MSEEGGFAIVTSTVESLKEETVSASDVRSCFVTEELSMTAAELETIAVSNELRDDNESVDEDSALLTHHLLSSSMKRTMMAKKPLASSSVWLPS